MASRICYLSSQISVAQDKKFQFVPFFCCRPGFQPSHHPLHILQLSHIVLEVQCLELDNQALDVVADISQLFICYNPLKLLSETRSLLVCSLSHACAVEHFCLSVMSLIYPH